MLYAIGEIVLIVIGILVALQINNWNARRIQKDNEKKIYQNIKLQVEDDRDELNEVRNFNNYYSAQFEYANQIILGKDRSKIDTLAIITMSLSQYSDFHRGGKIYETLVNSGELKLLTNPSITSNLQRLEMTYNYINKLEDIHWEIIINELSPEMRGVINYATLELVAPDKLYSVEIQNFIIESIFLTKGKDNAYKKALAEIQTIVELIKKELEGE
ncbi:DUF6090 family protein [Mangrovibacterium lignilyticum]|uniref:DUF6090 family protein n=1 Tax=Mangrovibacterium lignilyticum TaxID=2668052 RepID=UPI0013D22E89|nr:DUF6090 family protein [Mangrovibacterium lignilyticum]